MVENKEKKVQKYISLKVSWEERKRIDALENKLKEINGGIAVTQSEMIKYLLEMEEEAIALRRLIKSNDSIGSYSTPALIELVNAMEGALGSLAEVVSIVAATIRAGRKNHEERVGKGRGKHSQTEAIKLA